MPRAAFGGIRPFTTEDDEPKNASAISEGEEDFISKPAPEQIRRRKSSVGMEKPTKAPKVVTYQNLTPMYIGIAGNPSPDNASIEIGLSIHDSVYSTDFSVKRIHFADSKIHPEEVADFIVKAITEYSTEHLMKFVGAGVTEKLYELAPTLCGRLWRDLDIVALVFHVRSTNRLHARPSKKTDSLGFPLTPGQETPQNPLAKAGEAVTTTVGGLLGVATQKAQETVNATTPTIRSADEQADSAVRKAVLYFGPSGHNPRLAIGFRNEVEVDSAGRIHIMDSVEDYRATVRTPTWNAVHKYAEILKEKNIKIAFFSSTPQGGGVALMRHAMIRLMRLLGVDAHWYIPSPSPAVFRTTKNNHNILQGVADPSLRLTQAQQDQFTQWITYNAERYWLSEGGPLAAGGADVIFIDDPQMPGLIPLIKKARPNVPVLYRSHIEVRGDLVGVEGSPQAEVWQYLWDRIQQADMFISHPVSTFIPSVVPEEKVALLPATTDWLDGLSKHLNDWDIQYYMGLFRTACSELRMSKLHWPAREYICQVARFDPAKGIPLVIDSFVKLRRRLDQKYPAAQTPQLLICGHGAIDDPDATIIYSEILELLETPEYSHYASDIIVMRIPPSDQILNALMSSAKICLQLSLREGFEVKVSEALHKGKPVIATRRGGIPLQIIDGVSGYLVDLDETDPNGRSNCTDQVAKHLWNLWTKPELYKDMCDKASKSVSDEVGTWGNAAAWMYLAAKFGTGDWLKPNKAWVNDLMRADAGEPYTPEEPRLPRPSFSRIIPEATAA